MLSSKPRAVRRRTGVAISSLTTVLLLAACGGGSSADGSTQASTLNSAALTLDSADAAANKGKGNNGNGGGTNGGTTTGGTTTGGSTGGTTSGGTTGGTTGGTQTVTIDYYGDSTIWGYRSGVGGQVAVPAPAAFAAALPTTTNYVVRNEGVSGTTACQLLNGTDGKHPAWDTQLASTSANVVIVNFAINDEWQMDLATYKGCLSSLAQKARAAGKKFVFETPNPTRDSYSTGLDTWAQAMRDVARSLNAPVIDQYQYLKDYLAGASPYTICPDGLHPTDAVYIMKGQYAARMWPTLGL